MQLILAIEPDRRQAAQLSTVVRRRVTAELILVDTTERALDAIGNRVPDLVLVPALLSPQDDAALAAALRVIASAAHVQMLTIPVLGPPRSKARSGGVLSALRRDRAKGVEPDGCDPAVFAEQVASYLERAAQERPSAADLRFEADAPPLAGAVASSSAVFENAAPPVQPPMDPVTIDILAAFEDGIPLNEAAALDFVRAPEGMPRSVESAAAEAVEPRVAADESVSIALEEAVRALFSGAEPTTAAPAETRSDAPAKRKSPPPVAPQPAPLVEPAGEWLVDELMAVEDFIAALEAIPLGTIEATEGGDWAPSSIEDPDNVLEDPDDIDIDLTTELENPIEPEKSSTEKELGAGLWTALSTTTRTWPALEAMSAGDSASSVPAAGAQFEAAPQAAKGEREWVELIESLRLDVERLRSERAKPSPKTPTAAKTPPASRARRPKKVKPAQDEWGFFDPEQCGFAALLAKLDEVTDSEDGHAGVTLD